jgi:uncharacterized protein YmfQ (DUF2313 family)
VTPTPALPYPPRVTPFRTLLRAARLAAVPTPAERAARRGRGDPNPDRRGLTLEEVAARCRAAGHSTLDRASLNRAELGYRGGVSEALFAAVADALGVDVRLVPARARSGAESKRRPRE